MGDLQNLSNARCIRPKFWQLALALLVRDSVILGGWIGLRTIVKVIHETCVKEVCTILYRQESRQVELPTHGLM